MPRQIFGDQLAGKAGGAIDNDVEFREGISFPDNLCGHSGKSNGSARSDPMTAPDRTEISKLGWIAPLRPE